MSFIILWRESDVPQKGNQFNLDGTIHQIQEVGEADTITDNGIFSTSILKAIWALESELKFRTIQEDKLKNDVFIFRQALNMGMKKIPDNPLQKEEGCNIPPTDKQLRYARFLGIVVPYGASIAQVSNLISRAPATPLQIKWLALHGYPVDIKTTGEFYAAYKEFTTQFAVLKQEMLVERGKTAAPGEPGNDLPW
jgi:hypothetical protein